MIKVHFFAGLKRYFPEPISIESEGITTLLDVFNQLKLLKPDASELIEACRVAVDENFVSLDTPAAGVKEVFVIPPSSGG